MIRGVTATAKKIVKPIAYEPLEILKTAQKQISGTESKPNREEEERPQESQPQVKKEQPPDKTKLKARDTRQIQALEAEIKDIQMLRKQKEEEKKLEEARRQPEEKPGVPSIPSKRGRRLFGFKKKLQDLQRQVETRQPPSG